MEVLIRTSVLKTFEKIYKKNPKHYKIIEKAILEIGNDHYNKKYSSVIKYPPYKRSRAGNYRICFKIVNNNVYMDI